MNAGGAVGASANTRAILIMILSGGLLSVNDSFIKALQLDGMHVFEVVFFRNFFALISLLPLYARGGPRQLLTRRLGLHVVRNILQAVSMTLWFWALAFLALAEATVGIAMGTGTDVAMESAAVTLLKGDLRAIARARALSRATMRNIRQNLFLAFAYNLIGVPVAAGVLYPVFGLLITPMWASAAMTLSSLSVIGNALRLRNARL